MSLTSKIGTYGRNIWALATSKGAEKVESKTASKALSKVSRGSAGSTLRTTSKITGSTAKPISGGVSVFKDASSKFAKGISGTAKIGGVAIGATAAAAVPFVGFTKVYDYLSDERAKTTEQRQYEEWIKLADQDNKTRAAAQQRDLEYQQKLNKLTTGSGSASGLPSSDLAAGGSYSDMFPAYGMMAASTSPEAAQIASAKSSQTKSLVMGAVALAAIASGVYIYSKRKKKK